MTGPPDRPVRVVVTGMGCVSPVGNDRASMWDAVRHGRSGIARITAFDPSDLPSQTAGEVKDFDPVALLGHKEARRTSRPVQFAVAAAQGGGGRQRDRPGADLRRRRL